MQCTQCGNRLSPQAKFCLSCGGPVGTAQELSESSAGPAERICLISLDQQSRLPEQREVMAPLETPATDVLLDTSIGQGASPGRERNSWSTKAPWGRKGLSDALVLLSGLVLLVGVGYALGTFGDVSRLGLPWKIVGKDNSRVIATVGGEKITEVQFQILVRTLTQDPKEAQDFLTNPASRDSRVQLANQFAMSKAIIAYAKQTGLDQEPAVLRQMEQQQAVLYFQTLAKKRAQTAEPTDAQLLTFYQEQVERLNAQGNSQGIPPFEAVKAELLEPYKKARVQAISSEIENEIKAKVPVTLADDYRPAAN